MKKNLIIGLLLLISIFTIVGCTDDAKKEKFYELKYIEPKGYESVTEFGSEENRTKSFYYSDFDGSVSITYEYGKDYKEVEDSFFNEHTEEEINGTKWRVMDDENLGVKTRFYYTVYNNDLYLIELNGFDKQKKNMEEFIKNISFE